MDKTHREAADDFCQIMKDAVEQWEANGKCNPTLDKWDFWSKAENIKIAVKILNRQLGILDSIITGTTIVTPRRIQRKRTKGWRLPSNTVCVSRPSKWGNPFRVVRDRWAWNVFAYNMILEKTGPLTRCKAAALAVEFFEMHMDDPDLQAKARIELRGKNLACYCPLDHPCHADVLLYIANQ